MSDDIFDHKKYLIKQIKHWKEICRENYFNTDHQGLCDCTEDCHCDESDCPRCDDGNW